MNKEIKVKKIYTKQEIKNMINCPNCGGNSFIYNSQKQGYICEYCDTVFPVIKQVEESVQNSAQEETEKVIENSIDSNDVSFSIFLYIITGIFMLFFKLPLQNILDKATQIPEPTKLIIGNIFTAIFFIIGIAFIIVGVFELGIKIIKTKNASDN